MKSRPVSFQIKARSDILTFGKYQGQSVRWIIEHDPSYLIWVNDNTEWKVSQELLDAATDEEINQSFNDVMGHHLGHNYSSYYDDD